jgi:hypothetical protein
VGDRVRIDRRNAEAVPARASRQRPATRTAGGTAAEHDT